MTDKKPPFCLWQDLLNDGGLAVVSTYERYNGGLSPRDALALTHVLTSLTGHDPCRPIEARSFLSFEPEEWENHLILVGGLLSNQVMRAMAQSPLLRLRNSFVLRREILRDKQRASGRDCLTPTYAPGLETNVAGADVDYGLIAVQPNPMNLSKRLYVLAGIKGWGSLAAAMVFSSWKYYQLLNSLFERHFGLSAEEVNRCPLVEIVVRAEIGSTGAQGMRGLKDISVELVRVNGEQAMQWERSDSCLRWGPRPPSADRPEPKRFPGHLSISLNDRVAVVELRGAAFAVRFDESRLSPRELDWFDYDLMSAIEKSDWRVGAKIVAERLLEKLPSGFAELLHRIQIQEVRPEHSWVRFVTPREYLRAPFELLRTGRDYLVLEFPVFRAISNAFSVRSGLSPMLVEDLRLRNMPLRVLLVASDPSGAIRSEVIQEIESIVQIFQDMQRGLKVQVEVDTFWAEDATIERLQDALSGCPYHMFHFAGHSSWNPDNPEQSALLVSDGRGAKSKITAAQLATWLRNSELRLCFLSSCEGTQSDTERRLLRQDFLGLADALIQAGVSAVLGFRWPVSSGGALHFAQGFYQAFLGKANFNAEQAVLLARRKVMEQNRDDLTWLSPILIAQK
jgi:hypothetical protein